VILAIYRQPTSFSTASDTRAIVMADQKESSDGPRVSSWETFRRPVIVTFLPENPQRLTRTKR
jgi:hypothetical protein